MQVVTYILIFILIAVLSFILIKQTIGLIGDIKKRNQRKNKNKNNNDDVNNINKED